MIFLSLDNIEGAVVLLSQILFFRSKRKVKYKLQGNMFIIGTMLPFFAEYKTYIYFFVNVCMALYDDQNMTIEGYASLAFIPFIS